MSNLMKYNQYYFFHSTKTHFFILLRFYVTDKYKATLWASVRIMMHTFFIICSVADICIKTFK